MAGWLPSGCLAPCAIGKGEESVVSWRCARSPDQCSSLLMHGQAVNGNAAKHRLSTIGARSLVQRDWASADTRPLASRGHMVSGLCSLCHLACSPRIKLPRGLRQVCANLDQQIFRASSSSWRGSGSLCPLLSFLVFGGPDSEWTAWSCKSFMACVGEPEGMVPRRTGRSANNLRKIPPPKSATRWRLRAGQNRRWQSRMGEGSPIRRRKELESIFRD